MTDPEPRVIEKGKYRHNKSGNFYEVHGVALHSETGEQLVIYRRMYSDPNKRYEYEFFVRPYDMFVEIVELNGKHVPRFQKVDS